MPLSYDKAKGLGKLPACAICAGPGSGGRAELHLTHGVRVWLCAFHRSPEFRRRRGGRDLVLSLQEVWRAAGCLGAARRRALDALLVARHPHRRDTPRPGSYAWPDLRREAERRFGSGESPARVI